LDFSQYKLSQYYFIFNKAREQLYKKYKLYIIILHYQNNYVATQKVLTFY